MTLKLAKPTGAKLNLRKTWQPMDPDAAAYITAVDAADTAAGQTGGLEERVKIAIDNFVLGCKADGIWSAIKASCILAGARTRLGALTPLVGTAPTSFNFVDGDYNRKTGLEGSASSNIKYLNANRNNNADPQNSKHYAAWVSSLPTSVSSSTPFPIIAAFGTNTALSLSQITAGANLGGPPDRFFLRLNQTAGTEQLTVPTTGLIAFNRNNSTNIVLRNNKINTSTTAASAAPNSEPTLVFTRALAPSVGYTAGRLAFYSIGESLDLALLDARVTDLINAFGAAIP
jgi:hypothetical protein